MFRGSLYSEEYGYDLHHILQVPPDDALYRVVTANTDKWILLVGWSGLRTNANLIAPTDRFQARDGRNQFGDLDMPGDFMH